MSKLPVPVSALRFHPPVAGQLRFGKKTTNRQGKEHPVTIPWWRITSPHKELLSQLADLYGGEVKPWSEGPRDGEFELFTESRELKVLLPPDPLGDTPCYELWSGGGRLRRCDGRLLPPDGLGGGCWVPMQTGPDNAEEVEQDCLCRQEGALSCELRTRLQVVMAGVDFAGVFQLATGSDIAAEELPGMVQAVQHALNHRGMPYVLLGIVDRQARGGRRKFKVPVLRVPATIEDLVSGQDNAVLNAGAPAPAAPALPASSEAQEVDDDWSGPIEVEAREVVEETPPPAPAPAPAEPEIDLTVDEVRERQKAMFATLNELGHSGEDAHRPFVMAVSEGRTDSSKMLTRDEWSKLIDTLKKIHEGEYVYMGPRTSGDKRGWARVVKKK